MSRAQPIKIAILAMGGEGGGVLADWIVNLGEHDGYLAQSTSVPGVAQRTGATIYYVELFPRAAADRDGGAPVLALMPLPGDVDVVLASELMEAGRAVQRGLVTPDRTTLITSTHRVYSITEKTALGDGRVDSANLLGHAVRAAKRCVRFDMARTAADAGSVISAVLFGALAGSGVLPFGRARFEATIERGSVGVRPSLQAFDAAFRRAERGEIEAAREPANGALALPGATHDATTDATSAALAYAVPASVVLPRDPALRALLDRVRGAFAPAAHAMLIEGVRRLIDYQDIAYARLYLDRMAGIAALPAGAGDSLVNETARHLALWMSYDDTLRVAQLKTRATRFERVRAAVGVDENQLLMISEYMHPRVREIGETLPAGLGRWLERAGWPRRLVERMTRRGRVIATSSLHGFLLLWLVAGMRRWRRGTSRFALETLRIEEWLARIAEAAAVNPQLAVEIARCQRLVKGYSDTHERGVVHYETIMNVVRRLGAGLAAATLCELRDAALADERGDALRATLARLALI